MTISEKVAHLKGLIEGMELDANAKETKILNAVTDILDHLAMDLADARDEQETMSDYLDELDCDLGDVEEYLYGEDEDDEDVDFVEAVCPDCGERFCFEADADPENVVCPHCGGHFTCICQCDQPDADCADCVKLKGEDE